MKEIPLTQEKVALVDDEDYEEVMKHTWCAVLNKDKRTWYALTNVKRETKGYRTLRMHALILGRDSEGRTPDHIDGDGLNNQRANLRWATLSQQAVNRPASVRNQTGFKGVYFASYKPTGLYSAQLRTKNRGSFFLGYHKTPEEAAKAYDTKARDVYGTFARTNFDEDGERRW